LFLLPSGQTKLMFYFIDLFLVAVTRQPIINKTNPTFDRSTVSNSQKLLIDLGTVVDKPCFITTDSQVKLTKCQIIYFQNYDVIGYINHVNTALPTHTINFFLSRNVS